MIYVDTQHVLLKKRNIYLREEKVGSMIPCKIHPEARIQVNLANGLFCTLCLAQVKDYEVFRTDSDREI